MTRWLLALLALFFVVFLLIGTPPARAVTAKYSAATDGDEHPWDIFKSAYRVQILAVTEDYILVAVWYTKDQVVPTILRINVSWGDRSSSVQRERTKSLYILTD